MNIFPSNFPSIFDFDYAEMRCDITAANRGTVYIQWEWTVSWSGRHIESSSQTSEMKIFAYSQREWVDVIKLSSILKAHREAVSIET